MLQGIIFDFDGVLAPTDKRQHDWFKFYADACNRLSPWEFADQRAFMRFYNPLLAKEGGVQNVYDALGLPCDMKDKAHPVWKAYNDFNNQNPSGLYEGMKDSLFAIRKMTSLSKEDPLNNRRTYMGINSSNTWKTISKDLDKAGVIDLFEGFITTEVLEQYQGTGQSHALTKSSPISLHLMLDILDCHGGYVLHIGDTLNDLQASHRVQRGVANKLEHLITVGAAYGYEGREELEKGVLLQPKGLPAYHVHFDEIIDSPSELVAVVDKYMKKTAHPAQLK